MLLPINVCQVRIDLKSVVKVKQTWKKANSQIIFNKLKILPLQILMLRENTQKLIKNGALYQYNCVEIDKVRKK